MPDDLPAGLLLPGAPASSSLDYQETIERTKRELIARAFEEAGRNLNLRESVGPPSMTRTTAAPKS